MKYFQIIFSFMEPTQAVGTFMADSEEEAVDLLKQQLEGQVEDVVIESVKELTPDDARASVPQGTFTH